MPKGFYAYKRDRSECGMIDPVIRRLKDNGLFVDDWRQADIVIIPGDRREAMRFALDVFEAGKIIWHLGAGDTVDPSVERWHYDHQYRRMISELAAKTGGHMLCLHASPPGPGYYVVGPTMLDDIGRVDPIGRKPFALLCMNWERDLFVHKQFPSSLEPLAMSPGNDGDTEAVRKAISDAGYTLLPSMPRNEFLRYIKSADQILGNSSLLFYEATNINGKDPWVIGRRNAGRKKVYWDISKMGSPSDEVLRLALQA